MSSIGEMIGKNLKRAREEKGFSKESLGKAIGVSRQTIYTYEKGNGLLNSEIIGKISAILGVEESDLIAIEKPPPEQVILPKSQFEALVAFRPLPKQEQLIPADLLAKLSKLDERSRKKLFQMWDIQIEAALELNLKDEEKSRQGT